MPNNPRQQIKKDLDSAINHCDRIKEILLRTGEKYREGHPEILKEYETLYAFFEQGRSIIEAAKVTY